MAELVILLIIVGLVMVASGIAWWVELVQEIKKSPQKRGNAYKGTKKIIHYEDTI